METSQQPLTALQKRAQIARTFVERATAQHMAGARRDANAVEFFIGAMATAEAEGDKELSRVLSLVAFLVCSRGYAALQDIAKDES